MILLPAQLTSDLKWAPLLENAVAPFFLDFGWGEKGVDLSSELHFNSYGLAIDELNKSNAHGMVILARTSGKFEDLIKSPIEPDENAADLLSDYFHRLAALLDDRFTPAIELLPSSEAHLGELTLLFSKRRFTYFVVYDPTEILRHDPTASEGILLPQDDLYDPDRFLPLLEKGRYRIIPEEILNESWEGLDLLYVDEYALGETGRRMLLGFEAAGGEKKGLDQVI